MGLVEVGSPTPRGWASREEIGQRRRARMQYRLMVLKDLIEGDLLWINGVGY